MQFRRRQDHNDLERPDHEDHCADADEPPLPPGLPIDVPPAIPSVAVSDMGVSRHERERTEKYDERDDLLIPGSHAPECNERRVARQGDQTVNTYTLAITAILLAWTLTLVCIGFLLGWLLT